VLPFIFLTCVMGSALHSASRTCCDCSSSTMEQAPRWQQRFEAASHAGLDHTDDQSLHWFDDRALRSATQIFKAWKEGAALSLIWMLVLEPLTVSSAMLLCHVRGSRSKATPAVVCTCRNKVSPGASAYA